MVENDAYCINIIHQSQAVQKALKEVDSAVLENHLNCCVSEALQNGSKDQEISHYEKEGNLSSFRYALCKLQCSYNA